VTLYLKRLEAAGFVRREIDPADLRRHRLQLTPAGRRTTKDGLALLSDAFSKRLDRLTRAQQKELKNLLEQTL
jgi:DNA-binding MarR family transcriptional regulator